jgi:hypothetical protein
MSKLTFEIRPSPETNDHELLVLVDGKTVLSEDYMGVDPPEFFAQFSKADAGQLLIGRCRCGVVGCGDYHVAVETAPDSVTWRERKEFRFDRGEYEGAVLNASRDFSWEDQKRRAERLAGEILNGCQTDDGAAFQWASARIAPMLMKLSFLKRDEQKLLEFGWDGATDESVVQGARRFRKQLDEQ